MLIRKSGTTVTIGLVGTPRRLLWRGRRQQAERFREWARRQTKPVIAAGDYNFDFRNLTGNQSMAMFMRRPAGDGGAFVWQWVIPSAEFEVEGESDADRRVNLLTEFVDTSWSGDNGSDRFRDSMLDFIFVAGDARDWEATSRVIVRPGDFPDNDETSDHRPVEAVFDPMDAAVEAWRRLLYVAHLSSEPERRRRAGSAGGGATASADEVGHTAIVSLDVRPNTDGCRHRGVAGRWRQLHAGA